MIQDFIDFYGYAPHTTMDAGFSGSDILNILTANKWPFTISVNIAHFRTLFAGLSFFCPTNKWLAVADKKGRIWSIKKDSKENRTHFLVTNSFKIVAARDLAIFTSDDVKLLEKLSAPSLHFLTSQLGLPHLLDPKEAARSIAQLANKGKVLATVIPPKKNPSQTWTKEMLEQKNKDELITIIKDARWEKVSSNTKKNELVEIILNRQEFTGKEKEKLKEKIKEGIRGHGAIQHTHYKATFNSIDLHDRYWNGSQSHHTVRKWESKLTISLLQSAVVNAWNMFKVLNKKKKIPHSEDFRRVHPRN